MGNGGERFWKLGGFLEIEKKFFFEKNEIKKENFENFSNKGK